MRFAQHTGQDYAFGNAIPIPFVPQVFSTQTGTVMQSSNLCYQIWAIATYQMTMNLKGVSNMKLSRDLNVAQKNTWHLVYRIRESFIGNSNKMFRAFEVDETDIGGLEKTSMNPRNDAQGVVGKAVVIGVKDRNTRKVKAEVFSDIARAILHELINEHVEDGSHDFTDDCKSCSKIKSYNHEVVNHSASEYVNAMAHVNCIESLWAMIKRTHKGTHHRMSTKHLRRYVVEFEGRHNVRELNTIDQMSNIVKNIPRKRLKYSELESGVDHGLN